jgi:hypothetical protein
MKDVVDADGDAEAKLVSNDEVVDDGVFTDNAAGGNGVVGIDIDIGVADIGALVAWEAANIAADAAAAAAIAIAY